MPTLREDVDAQATAGAGGPPRSLDPWTADSLARLIAVNLVGVVLIGLGWYQSSGQGDVRTELSWLEVAIAGALIAGLGNAAWLVRGRRQVRIAVAAAMNPLFSLESVAVAAPRAGATTAQVLIWVPRTGRVHDGSCPLVSGKDVRLATAEQARTLTRCEICLDI
jgi:hypothetical protein